MSAVTICPNCNSQFAVTKKQLSQYNGKVRCGHCLHVFDATIHIKIDDAVVIEMSEKSITQTVVAEASNIEAVETTAKSQEDDAWPSIEIKPEDDEQAASIIKSAEEIIEQTKGTEFEADEDEDFAIETIDYSIVDHSYGLSADEALLSNPKQATFEPLSNIAHSIPRKREVKKTFSWLKSLLILLLSIAAIAQAIYFMRDEIAIYYPSTKPYLEQACDQIGCSVNLPKKIDFIVIDDSDMQEDTERLGLIRLTCTLINQAGFTQAYPNLELTLTDANDKPRLRRTFKPAEYLPEHTVVENGLGAGAEIKVKLAITARGETVTGYRLFVTY